jgi:hypothetical protein
MGGIICLSYLTENLDVAKKVRFVALYSTPCGGTGIAKYLTWIPKINKNVGWLENVAGGALEAIDVWWQHMQSHPTGRTKPIPLFCAYEKVPTGPVLIVSEDSAIALSGIGRSKGLDYNHVEICKPKDPNDPRFLFLKDAMEQTPPNPIIPPPKKPYLWGTIRVTFGAKGYYTLTLNHDKGNLQQIINYEHSPGIAIHNSPQSYNSIGDQTNDGDQIFPLDWRGTTNAAFNSLMPQLPDRLLKAFVFSNTSGLARVTVTTSTNLGEIIVNISQDDYAHDHTVVFTLKYDTRD